VKRILMVLSVAAVMAAMMLFSAPAFAHQAGPCIPANDPFAAEPGHSEFAGHHVVPLAQSGVPGADRHVPGEHSGFSFCNPSGR
jgi:hypothetical protein